MLYSTSAACRTHLLVSNDKVSNWTTTDQPSVKALTQSQIVISDGIFLSPCTYSLLCSLILHSQLKFVWDDVQICVTNELWSSSHTWDTRANHCRPSVLYKRGTLILSSDSFLTAVTTVFISVSSPFLHGCVSTHFADLTLLTPSAFNTAIWHILQLHVHSHFNILSLVAWGSAFLLRMKALTHWQCLTGWREGCWWPSV